ncbi:MAG: hypothetical protein EDM03_15465 [Porphyrobacter sp. IPPAS B-1204]|nr:MAG: hypothetical protein EDM03_15465 [Porphyrobacter sp. IPPAS B-1204]
MLRKKVLLVLVSLALVPLAAFAQSNGWIRPSSGVVSHPFYGERYAKEEGVQHVGVDIDAAAGDSVFAPASGTLLTNVTARSDINEAYLIIRQEGTQFQHVVAHISSDLRVGARVRQGDVIGTVRAWSGNEHVHWGVFRGNMSATFDGVWGFGRVPLNVSKADAMARGWMDPLALSQVVQPRPQPRPPGSTPPMAIPVPPRLQSPGFPNSTRMEPIRSRVQFSWMPSTGATGYEVEARDAQSKEFLFGQSTSNTRVWTNLPAGRSVEWVARACNPSGCSSDSRPLYFSTQGAIQTPAPTPGPTASPTPAPRPSPRPSPPRPAPPLASIPATPATAGPGSAREPGPAQSATRVTLEWSAVSGATEYDLGVRDLTTNRLVFDRRISATAQRVTIEPGGRYRWNVAACNPAGCSRFTTPLYFTVSAGSPGGGGAITNAVPDIPRTTSPGRSTEPGQRLSIDSATLQWGDVRGATHYEVEIRDLAAKRNISIGPLKQRFHIFKMKKGSSYRWSVRACNATGCSAWSDRLYFISPS